ncbi:MAG TPA: SRPBCC family protein [Pseudomonadales bacterium]
MTTVTVSENVNASADRVWAVLSDFGGIRVGGPITSVEVEGQGVGMVRTLGLGGGKVIERLDRFDPSARVFGYSIINDDCPLPVSGYSATVQITDNGDGTCKVDWTGRFEPKGSEEEARKVVEGIYRGGIAAARQATGG